MFCLFIAALGGGLMTASGNSILGRRSQHAIAGFDSTLFLFGGRIPVGDLQNLAGRTGVFVRLTVFGLNLGEA